MYYYFLCRLPLLHHTHTHTNNNNNTHPQILQDLVDAHIFVACQPILDALARHDCTPALEWCAANRARLKKSKSKLEFSLRVQEFVELVRAGATSDAIVYARTHLAPWSSTYLDDMLRAFALVVMARAEIDKYQVGCIGGCVWLCIMVGCVWFCCVGCVCVWSCCMCAIDVLFLCA